MKERWILIGFKSVTVNYREKKVWHISVSSAVGAAVVSLRSSPIISVKEEISHQRLAAPSATPDGGWTSVIFFGISLSANLSTEAKSSRCFLILNVVSWRARKERNAVQERQKSADWIINRSDRTSKSGSRYLTVLVIRCNIRQRCWRCNSRPQSGPFAPRRLSGAEGRKQRVHCSTAAELLEEKTLLCTVWFSDLLSGELHFSCVYKPNFSAISKANVTKCDLVSTYIPLQDLIKPFGSVTYSITF